MTNTLHYIQGYMDKEALPALGALPFLPSIGKGLATGLGYASKAVWPALGGSMLYSTGKDILGDDYSPEELQTYRTNVESDLNLQVNHLMDQGYNPVHIRDHVVNPTMEQNRWLGINLEDSTFQRLRASLPGKSRDNLIAQQQGSDTQSPSQPGGIESPGDTPDRPQHPETEPEEQGGIFSSLFDISEGIGPWAKDNSEILMAGGGILSAMLLLSLFFRR